MSVHISHTPGQQLMDKPPALSPSEISTEEGRFIADVQRELTIRGDSSKTIHALMIEMWDRLTVTPRFSSPETRYRSRHGGLLNAKQAAEAIVEEADERDRLAAHGPDPEGLLRDRLVALGVPEAEARSLSPGRVKRLEDGRVIARRADGKLLYGGPGPDPGKKYTEEQKASFADAGHAVRMATRAILEEREKKGASEEALNEKRSIVRGAL